jgi:hypothetical protein
LQAAKAMVSASTIDLTRAGISVVRCSMPRSEERAQLRHATTVACLSVIAMVRGVESTSMACRRDGLSVHRDWSSTFTKVQHGRWAKW